MVITTSSNINQLPQKRRGQDRKKIEMKKIKEKSNLQVTFTKRRNGLFKKAYELCLLCGAEVSIITFSPAQKPYAFGHPDVELLLNRYLIGTDPSSSSSSLEAKYNTTYMMNEAKIEYQEALKELEEEKKKRAEMIGKMSSCGGGGELGFWWDQPIDDNMGLEELEEYVKAMQEMQKNVVH